MNLLKRFLRDERGLELSEYAVMAALIIAVAAIAITAVGLAITNRFEELQTYIGPAQ